MTEPQSIKIESITGRLVPVRGDDIDTDRIIPARFLRCVTFEGIGAHAFEDDRLQLGESGSTHPFDDSRFEGGSILIVNRNFGCGSSREHAPQSLMRWGIRAIVGESFAEIFFGNCVALGIPCLTAPGGDIARLQNHADEQPEAECVIDIATTSISIKTPGSIKTPTLSITGSLSQGPREAFLTGTWDATALLLENSTEVERVATHLPYIKGW